MDHYKTRLYENHYNHVFYLLIRMRSVQVPRANGPLELVEREIPEPGNRQVRIKVQACGICHSDSFTKEGLIGWPAGTSRDSQDTLSFSVLSGVRSTNEVFPLERAAEAYDHMMSGKAKFRSVLTTGN